MGEKKHGTLKLWYGICVSVFGSVFGYEASGEGKLKTVVLKVFCLFRKTKLRISNKWYEHCKLKIRVGVSESQKHRKTLETHELYR